MSYKFFSVLSLFVSYTILATSTAYTYDQYNLPAIEIHLENLEHLRTSTHHQEEIVKKDIIPKKIGKTNKSLAKKKKIISSVPHEELKINDHHEPAVMINKNVLENHVAAPIEPKPESNKTKNQSVRPNLPTTPTINKLEVPTTPVPKKPIVEAPFISSPVLPIPPITSKPQIDKVHAEPPVPIKPVFGDKTHHDPAMVLTLPPAAPITSKPAIIDKAQTVPPLAIPAPPAAPITSKPAIIDKAQTVPPLAIPAPPAAPITSKPAIIDKAQTVPPLAIPAPPAAPVTSKPAIIDKVQTVPPLAIPAPPAAPITSKPAIIDKAHTEPAMVLPLPPIVPTISKPTDAAPMPASALPSPPTSRDIVKNNSSDLTAPISNKDKAKITLPDDSNSSTNKLPPLPDIFSPSSNNSNSTTNSNGAAAALPQKVVTTNQNNVLSSKLTIANLGAPLASIIYNADQTELNSDIKSELTGLFKTINNKSKNKFKVIGYASEDNKFEETVISRKKSLQRVVNIRKFLISQGISPSKITIQAAGIPYENLDDKDRVDVFITNEK